MSPKALATVTLCAFAAVMSSASGVVEDTTGKPKVQGEEMISFLEDLDFDLLWSVRDDLSPRHQELLWHRLLEGGNATDGNPIPVAIGYLADLGKQWEVMNLIATEKRRLGLRSKTMVIQPLKVDLVPQSGEDTKETEVSVPLFKRLSSFAFNRQSPFLSDPELALEFFDALFRARIPVEDRSRVVSAVRLMFDLSVPIVFEHDDWDQVWMKSEGRQMLAEAVSVKKSD